MLFFAAALLLGGCGPQATVRVGNPTDSARENETVEVAWADVASAVPGVTPDSIVVTTAEGDTVPAQVTYEGGDSPVSLIFQASVPGGASRNYRLSSGVQKTFDPQVYGRYVPERMDDFAWENNVVGFRMYGPALEATGEISNGIDVWLKRTDKLVIDKWYKAGDYHTDHGEGLDGYKVGRTLGAGAMAPYVKDTLWLGNNYASYRILDRGPLRLTFELTYAPYEVDGQTVSEKRIVSLDANSHFNRITEIYDRPLDVAAAIVLRPENGEIMQQDNWMAYREPAIGQDGHPLVAVIMPCDFEAFENCGHLLARASVEANEPFTYYGGAGWDKAGFDDAAAWSDYVRSEAEKRTAPLRVQVR